MKDIKQPRERSVADLMGRRPSEAEAALILPYCVLPRR
jgi:hypothetical protein